MAITRRSASSTAFTGLSAGGNMTIAQPSGAVSGDVVYIGISCGASCTPFSAASGVVFNTPSGWNRIGFTVAYMDSQHFTSNIAVYRRKLDGSESWPITFVNPGTITSTFAFGEIHAICLTGVDGTVQEDVTPTGTDAITQGGGSSGAGGTAGQGQTTAWPTQTTATAGCYTMAWESMWDATSFTAPSGGNVSLAWEYNGGGTSGTSGSGLLGCWVGTNASAQATGSITRATNGNNNTNQINTSSWASLLVSARPSSGAATKAPAIILPRPKRFITGFRGFR